MKTVFAILITSIVATAARADDVDPSQVHVTGVQYSGTGCREGTAAVNLAPDAKAFTLIFSEYLAVAESPIRRSQRQCQVTVDLAVPAGWTFAMVDVDLRGYAKLSPGAQGLVLSSVAYPPRLTHARLANIEIRGIFDDDYHRRMTVPLPDRITAPCRGGSAKFVIKTSLGVSVPHLGSGLMTVDSVDGQLSQTYGLSWRRCAR